MAMPRPMSPIDRMPIVAGGGAAADIMVEEILNRKGGGCRKWNGGCSALPVAGPPKLMWYDDEEGDFKAGRSRITTARDV